MGMRVTTKATLSGYNRNLNKTMSNLNISRNRFLTKRNFNEVWEDPSGAAKSFKLRRAHNRNEIYLENTKTSLSMYDSIAASTLQVSTRLREEINESSLRGVNGATGLDARKVYATTLREMQESIVLSMNDKYGDRFLFNGAETGEVPFELKDGKLFFRGIDVDSTDPNDLKILEGSLKETIYSDIGFGLEEDANGDVVSSSALNTAISGLEVLGFGLNADGKSKNTVNIIGELADVLEQPDLDEDEFKKCFDQFVECKNNVADFAAKLGVRCQQLEGRQKQLEANNDSLNEQIVNVENVDMAAAISDYVWQQYAYNAALKVGTSILSPSFIDFMG
ncbi:MAG: hypothetical protein HFE62_05315 [Firmicutes bacterium]|nr:hypothetical protein [Bacillota bacterium]